MTNETKRLDRIADALFDHHRVACRASRTTWREVTKPRQSGGEPSGRFLPDSSRPPCM